MNLLARSGKTYVMDNHKLALWCWLQHIDLGKKYQILHIDAHTDLDPSAKDLDFAAENCSLEEFLSLPKLRWDNYLSYFIDRYPASIEAVHLFTHDRRELPGPYRDRVRSVAATQLLRNLRKIASSDIGSWIVNVDADFFFQMESPRSLRVFSDEFVTETATLLRDLHRSGQIEVLTFALSPECCGAGEGLVRGWEMALKFCEEFFRNLGPQFDARAYGVSL